VATAKTLRSAGISPLPPLPAAKAWNPLTLAWWADVQRSAMAPEYEASDVHGLLILAALVDEFWSAPSKEMAAEIRLQRAEFGLSPLARRRLQWEIVRTEDAQHKAAERKRRPARSDDPRLKG
jgi:hypothetical protein